METALVAKVNAIREGKLDMLKTFKKRGMAFRDIDIMPALQSKSDARLEVLKFLVEECGVKPRGAIVLKLAKSEQEKSLLQSHLSEIAS